MQHGLELSLWGALNDVGGEGPKEKAGHEQVAREASERAKSSA